MADINKVVETINANLPDSEKITEDTLREIQNKSQLAYTEAVVEKLNTIIDTLNASTPKEPIEEPITEEKPKEDGKEVE